MFMYIRIYAVVSLSNKNQFNISVPTLMKSEQPEKYECVKLAWNSQLGIRFDGLLGLELG